MSYNSQELLTLHQHISSPQVLVGSVFSPAPRFTPGFGGVCVFTSTLVHPRGLVGSVLIIVLVFGVVRLCLFCFVFVFVLFPVDCSFVVFPSTFSNIYSYTRKYITKNNIP